MGKVKVIGYAKRVYYADGIEYRDFSPDLVGNQLTSDGGSALFTAGNFNVTTNIDGKLTKNFITNDFGDFMTLSDLKVSDNVNDIFIKRTKQVKLNLDKTDVLNHALFGSLMEYVRISLENIIITWPASINVIPYNTSDPTLSGLTALNYYYDSARKESSFKINTDLINNPYGINFMEGGTLVGTFNESNPLRDLTSNFKEYSLLNGYGEFPVLSFSGSSGVTSSLITLVVKGEAFPLYSIENIPFHIKPNIGKVEEFFIGLTDFESNLLNINVIPKYTAKIKVYSEMDNGDIVESINKVTWPVSDGYNIDFNTIAYTSYVNNLIAIAESNDSNKSDLVNRFFVSKSISEFDTIPDIDGSYIGNNGQKMNSALKIYGREFDEIRKYSSGISFANVVTYNKQNNTPDSTVKNLARILGWDLTSSLSESNLLDNYLTPSSNNFDGHSKGLTKSEAEIELWRRIILNTPWIWKSKGTRKAVEFLFKFIGTPDGLVTFNEYLYVADKVIDIQHLKDMMLYFNGTDDISELNVNSEGFPKISPNNADMYFQKAGLWYRITGGQTPDIDILYGNNPHIGPYDGGQEYVDEFGTCLIPNFEVTRIVDLTYGAPNTDVLFTNYNNGQFDDCCEGDLVAILDTNVDFSATLRTNIDNFINNTSNVIESTCDITSNWTLKASLNGEPFYENIFFSGISLPLSSDYIDELNVMITAPELSATTSVMSGTNYVIVDDYTDCASNLLGAYLKVEVCAESNFDCQNESESPNANVTGDSLLNCDPLSGATVTPSPSTTLTIDEDTRIFMYFDASNSMNRTLTALNTAKASTLKTLLLSHYNNDETLYNQMVTIENFPLTGESYPSTYPDTGGVLTSSYERFLAVMNMKNQPSPDGNVIVLTFTDEATNKYCTTSFLPTDARTSHYNVDITNLRARLSRVGPDYYRGAIFEVMSGYSDAAKFTEFLDAIRLGQGNYAGEFGISDKAEQIKIKYGVLYTDSAQYYTDIIEETLKGFGFNI